MEAFTAETFASRVRAGRIPVLVDFASAGCPPCRMLRPILDKLAHQLREVCLVGTVDVDSEPGLAAAHDITSMPTLVLFLREGVEVARWIGFRPEAELRRLLAERGIEQPGSDSRSVG
jgi:thioredoxin